MQATATCGPGKRAHFEALRRHVARLERAGVVESAPVPAPLRFGVTAIDEALPAQGLAGGRLHEFRGGETAVGDGAVTAVTAALAGRATRETGKPVAWIGGRETLFLPGLAGLGLTPTELIVVTAKDDASVLWAAEECLRGGGVGCVVSEVSTLSLVASRRLQLAAEIGGATGLLLRGDTLKGAPPPSACATSWRVTPLPGGVSAQQGLMGPARWRLDLLRCRGGVPQGWEVEWSHDTGGFVVAAPVRQRPVVPATGTMFARAG